ncbi:hypothetical protein PO461_23715, partial [Enterobacter asburiae]|uniref:hypothetical protein n=1 Tax=Enterobacter asburiae TaxID=61645 RepID=UPI002FFD275D
PPGRRVKESSEVKEVYLYCSFYCQHGGLTCQIQAKKSPLHAGKETSRSIHHQDASFYRVAY